MSDVMLLFIVAVIVGTWLILRRKQRKTMYPASYVPANVMPRRDLKCPRNDIWSPRSALPRL